MIKAFVGLAGSGKTLSMVQESYVFLKQGIRIVSNIPFTYRYLVLNNFRDIRETKKIARWGEFTSEYCDDIEKYFWMFTHSENTIFVLDEGGIYLSNYDWNKVDVEIYRRFQEIRHYNIHLLYTVQDYSLVVMNLRKLTNEVAECSAPLRSPFKEKFPYSQGKPLVIRTITYNPKFYNFLTPPPIEQEAKFIIRRGFIFGIELDHVFKAYNSKDKKKK